jgi:hypothetical protein
MRLDVEVLVSGVYIDWSKTLPIETASGKKNYQRKVYVSCSSCRAYRYINSCSLWQIRQGKQKECWKCHKKSLANRNTTGVEGRHKNIYGYVIRTLASFTQEELEFLKPMLRKGGKKKATEILEHRALFALHHKIVLKNTDIIHHINGIKDDNRISNLELTDSRGHLKEHSALARRLKELEAENKKLKEALENK